MNRKRSILLFSLCGLLFFQQVAYGDDLQQSLNLDYFRTPEAAAFKKYGEEVVNEYTGTANISVPLYTIKCRDIEIPLVLQYEASGIKVEQEASWVGLGWNLMVGGCINYVSAGGTDIYGERNVSDNIWTEYLTSEFGPWTYGSATNGGSYDMSEMFNPSSMHRTQTRYYTYNPNETSNWMNQIPYNKSFVPAYVDQFATGGGMREYIDYGFGERDFYCVNVLGKSFKFFVDPFTLKIFNIGQAGEEFKVQPEPALATRGIGTRRDIQKWFITDSDGFIYCFEVRDRLADTNHPVYYTSCWYLSEITTPLGEVIEFSYIEHVQSGRATRVESNSLAIAHMGGGSCCANTNAGGYSSYPKQATVTSHYLNEIKTSNQTVKFITTASNQCSGRRLDAIKVKLNDTNSTEIKRIEFTYGTFGYSNVGGNYAPASNSLAEYRLKLNSVKEIALSETLTTQFSYNSLNLPSKRSCAQDYWGYYNGQDNNVSGRGNTLVPSPQTFMSLNCHSILGDYTIQGADRYSRANYMQAAMLNRVDYPTGGYTIYEYEPNSIVTGDISLTEEYRQGQFDLSIQSRFSCSNSPYGNVVDQSEQSKFFSLSQGITCDLVLKCNGPAQMDGADMRIEIYKWNNQTYGLWRSFPVHFVADPQETTFIQSLTLDAANYHLLIIPPSVSGQLSFSVSCYLNGWYNNTLSQGRYPMTCGGLRIKKISNYESNGSMINYTTYDYNNNGITSGKLLDKIETIDYSQCFNYNPIGGLPGTHTVAMYTFTPGHSRMPAFFTTCNPGIVGYSKVTKRKYNSNNNLEKTVITSYINNEPTNMKIDYYDYFENGLISSQEVYDSSGSLANRIANTYTRDRIHYATNIITQNKWLNTGGSNGDGTVDVCRYPYILSRVDLSRTTNTEYSPGGGTIVNTKEYQYDTDNHQVSLIDESTSVSGQKQRTRIDYTTARLDNVSQSMITGKHILNAVVRQRKFLLNGTNELPMETTRTNYALFNNSYYLPASVSHSVGSASLESRMQYAYDSKNNVNYVAKDGVTNIVYLWSYKGMYPIAKIEGMTYNGVLSLLGSSYISGLSSKLEPEASDYNRIRTTLNLDGVLVTTYTYKPLVGVTSETLPNGITTYYEYDGFGRLKTVKDTNHNAVSNYKYHYK